MASAVPWPLPAMVAAEALDGQVCLLSRQNDRRNKFVVTDKTKPSSGGDYLWGCLNCQVSFPNYLFHSSFDLFIIS